MLFVTRYLRTAYRYTAFRDGPVAWKSYSETSLPLKGWGMSSRERNKECGCAEGCPRAVSREVS